MYVICTRKKDWCCLKKGLVTFSKSWSGNVLAASVTFKHPFIRLNTINNRTVVKIQLLKYTFTVWSEHLFCDLFHTRQLGLDSTRYTVSAGSFLAYLVYQPKGPCTIMLCPSCIFVGDCAHCF